MIVGVSNSPDFKAEHPDSFACIYYILYQCLDYIVCDILDAPLIVRSQHNEEEIDDAHHTADC